MKERKKRGDESKAEQGRKEAGRGRGVLVSPLLHDAVLLSLLFCYPWRGRRRLATKSAGSKSSDIKY